MPRPKRSPQELRDISGHLHYEFIMLTGAAMHLAIGKLTDQVLVNAVLESFTIHTRAIMDFLYASNPRDDDVIAEDFMPAGVAWKKARPALTPALDLAKKRAGKEIAHLTYARLAVAPEAKPWPFMQLKADIEAAFKVFVSATPKEHLHPDWGK